ERNTALGIRADLAGAGEEHPRRIELRLALLGPLPHFLGHPFPLLRRVDDQALVLTLGDDRAVGEWAPEVRREDQAPLGVQGVLVLPQEVLHVPSPKGDGATRPGRSSTSNHFVALYGHKEPPSTPHGPLSPQRPRQTPLGTNSRARRARPTSEMSTSEWS